jgi:hypothetical protein
VAAKLLDISATGRHRIDRYELIGEIASGGMATVFLARLTGLGGFQRFVALKRLHPHLQSEKDFVRMFLDDPGLWVMPNPLRWSWIEAISIACSLGECSHRTLASLSTTAGIIVVGLTWVIARELFGSQAGLAATALAATSPLQLALGRRALADEFFCAAVLASIATLLLLVRTNNTSVPERRAGLRRFL